MCLNFDHAGEFHVGQRHSGVMLKKKQIYWSVSK